MRTPHCQNGHERIQMYPDHINKSWICPECHLSIGQETIDREIPAEYKTLEAKTILDFEIQPVILTDRRILIEYPRKGIN